MLPEVSATATWTPPKSCRKHPGASPSMRRMILKVTKLTWEKPQPACRHRMRAARDTPPTLRDLNKLGLHGDSFNAPHFPWKGIRMGNEKPDCFQPFTWTKCHLGARCHGGDKTKPAFCRHCQSPSAVHLSAAWHSCSQLLASQQAFLCL